jgi:uncharacterized protein YjiK
VILACLLGAACVHLGYFDIALQHLLIRTSGESPTRLGLEDYCVDIDALPIAGIEKNISGLSYHPGRNSLFAVINRPPQIAELTLDGRLERAVPVKGVEDLEGITHVRGDEFFIVDERLQQVIHLRVGEDSDEVDTQGRPRIGLAFDLAGNYGLEGVSWDHTRNRLFVVKEKRPLRLFEIAGLFDDRWLDLQISEWPLAGWIAWCFRDLSSLSYHEASGNLLLLSDESRLVVELDPQRHPSGLMTLRRGRHGLKADVPQAEGIAVGASGEIFLVSEPNLFYRFDPRCR